METLIYSTALYCDNGGSDKVYLVAIVKDGSTYTVRAWNGPRLGAAQHARIFSNILDKSTAEATMMSIVHEKVRKSGYREDDPLVPDDPWGVLSKFADARDGRKPTPCAKTPKKPAAVSPLTEQKPFKGILPMLLNPVSSEAELESLLDDPAWALQWKRDGVRGSISLEAGAIFARNRRGAEASVPDAVATAAFVLPVVGRTIIDGEFIGERFHAFDVIAWNGCSLMTLPFRERLAYLDRLGTGDDTSALVRDRTALTSADKRALYADVLASGGEGVVFKHLNAPYEPGRPNSGGVALKWKFVATATVRVRAHSAAKRSVAMELRSGDTWIAVGNVTIPANFDVPPVGALVECRYLYARRGGAITQPVFLGSRDDVDETACSIDQLKYKAEPTREAA